MQYTRFGRTVYAVGGNEQSARLMGLNVARTKVLVYVISGVCGGLAGLRAHGVLRCRLPAQRHRHRARRDRRRGHRRHAADRRHRATCSGSMVGVFVYGTIKTVISFMGAEQSWTRIIIGLLLLLFIVVQRVDRRPLGAPTIGSAAWSGDNEPDGPRRSSSSPGRTVYFGADAALDGVDFRLFPGEVHSLMGENGAGQVDADQGDHRRAPAVRRRAPPRRRPWCTSAPRTTPSGRRRSRLPGDRPAARTSRSPRTSRSAASRAGSA